MHSSRYHFYRLQFTLDHMHEDFKESHVHAFVSDLTADDLCKEITPSSVDIVTMPNGYVLLRDYATGDLAQERFSGKDQKISDNFYVRGDGTVSFQFGSIHCIFIHFVLTAYYFSNEFLTNLFKENGFEVHKIDVCCKEVENRSRELIMKRRWVQAVFCVSDGSYSSSSNEAEANHLDSDNNIGRATDQNNCDSLTDTVIDMSEGVAADIGWTFKINLLSKEYQHTCKSTGLMLWESARLMASVLAENPNIVAGKRVLELGCGSGGICSMIASRHANQVVATDGDDSSLDLLAKNVASNIESPLLNKLTTKKLEWGNKDHIESIKELNVTYIAEAIVPLFGTAKELIASSASNKNENVPALILCHIFRRVDEPTLLSAAAQFGFRLVDKWPTRISTEMSRSVIDNWFMDNDLKDDLPSKALNILLFCQE
ncbi:hypothetical protein TSUD_06930 [Trifolium subterraneum]|uniref:Uncharacterized protein n=1 Tax=Trifolium subterraneum TaxID=3900 RepID=A0A2Z6PMK5_TRISU|nr:hypothetical protein TSUD_06930 [Trifolium subterraneum]